MTLKVSDIGEKELINHILSKSNHIVPDDCAISKFSNFFPFNTWFIDMFRDLQLYDPDYHQVHINEIMYQKTKSK